MLSDPQKRPIYLNLFQFHFPVTAILSITHRVTGVAILALLPLYLFLLHQSLVSAAHFASVSQLMTGNTLLQLISVAFFSALAFHVYAGVRHMIMDCGIGESLAASRLSAWIVFALSALDAMSFAYFFFVMLG